MYFHLFLLLLAVFACSTAAVMIKASNLTSNLEVGFILSGYRCLLASVFLLPLFLRDFLRFRASYTLFSFRTALLPGIVFGLHILTWIISVRMTTAANSTLIVTMTPIIMPFFLYFIYKETLKRSELLATILTIAGVIILSYADFQLSRQHFYGDLLSLFSLILLTWYLVLARINKNIPSIWLYVVPLYFVAGILALALAPFFNINPIRSFSTREILVIAGLALIPTVIGHSIFNYCMRHLSSQLVAIVTPVQFIFAGILAYIFFEETVHWPFFIACSLLVAAIFIVIKAKSENNLI